MKKAIKIFLIGLFIISMGISAVACDIGIIPQDTEIQNPNSDTEYTREYDTSYSSGQLFPDTEFAIFSIPDLGEFFDYKIEKREDRTENSGYAYFTLLTLKGVAPQTILDCADYLVRNNQWAITDEVGADEQTIIDTQTWTGATCYKTLTHETTYNGQLTAVKVEFRTTDYCKTIYMSIFVQK